MAVAAAMTAVASQPLIIAPRRSVSRPMARGLLAISIITVISGAASTPLTTAAQNRARAGSTPI